MHCLVRKCYTYDECDVIQRVGVMTQTSDCDVTWIVYILNCILDVISYVKFVLSQVP